MMPVNIRSLGMLGMVFILLLIGDLLPCNNSNSAAAQAPENAAPVVLSAAALQKKPFLIMRDSSYKEQARSGNWPVWIGQDVWEQFYFPSNSPSSEGILEFFRAQRTKKLRYADLFKEFCVFGNEWLRNIGKAPMNDPMLTIGIDGGADDNFSMAMDGRIAEFLIERMKKYYTWFPEITLPLERELAELRVQEAGANDPRWPTLLFNGVLERAEIAHELASPQQLEESARCLSDVYGKDGIWKTGDVAADCQNLKEQQQAIRVSVGSDFTEGNQALRSYVAINLAARRRLWYGEKDVQQATTRTGLVNLSKEWEDQWRVLQREMSRPEWYAAVAPYTYHPASLCMPTDRDPADIVVRRTETLLAELEEMTRTAPPPALTAARTRLTLLKTHSLAIDPLLVDARKALFMQASLLRRTIAFANPLLNFEKIVFVKHNQPALFTRAHHQFYGEEAGDWAIGGLFQLQSPFTNTASVRDLLADAKCTNGMRAGQLLVGSFHTPIVSYDASTIYFAYCETLGKDARGRPLYDAERNQYHLYRVSTDGSGLTQLTFGKFSDFSPCELPDGSLIFISTRRGGYTMGDTNGQTPVFTLFRLDRDGTKPYRLSPHVDHEWDPVIAHDGGLIYTRWDIWDRGYISGMGLFRSMPDGRDPRSILANYRKFNYYMPGGPPNQIMDTRPVPENNKLMAAAISYFDPSYGSIILIDPSRPDNGLQSNIQRLTPEQWFPSEEFGRNEGPMQYGTPWPISEKFFLCVYDSKHDISQGSASNFGVYLVDAFGNKELLFRDPKLSCFRPIPLRPQAKPPILPDQVALKSLVTEATAVPLPAAAAAPAFVGIVNVRDSRYPWPEELTASRLRIVAALPKTTPYFEKPAMGYGSNKGGRIVLGTVPIEEDGSVYFQMPEEGVDAPILFQVLDDKGVAIQGMRELTTVKPGERLFCMGCHEQPTQAPALRNSYPRAFRSKPSTITPEPENGKPLTFPRLVQPILDKNCAACHSGAERQAPDLSRGDWEKHPNKFFTSYVNLEKYVQCFKAHIGEQVETKPGKFGARVSPLYLMLQQGHHEVKLTDDEWRRLALWIDCNARFFGSYENLDAQARGESVMPTLR